MRNFLVKKKNEKHWSKDLFPNDTAIINGLILKMIKNQMMKNQLTQENLNC